MHMYPENKRSRRHAPRHRPRNPPPCFTQTGHATVVTVLEPSVRGIIDRATDGAFTKVHVDSVAEAIRAVREHSAVALLVSSSIAMRHSRSEISNLVAKVPGALPVAILADDWPVAHHALLDLGACGVREVVNLGEREGWTRLRSLVDQIGGECASIVTREILGALEGGTNDVRHFFATVVRIAPTTTSVRMLANALSVEPSTLMSRFFRASLPAPKMYLSMARLLYAAWFLEIPKVSIAATANALHYSSPQSFGRHIQMLLGLTAGEFRKELTMRVALDHFVGRLITPYSDTLQRFRPIG